LLSARADFYAFFKEHDDRRGTDFATTFPELSALAMSSKEAYNKLKGN
jgi:hypothetical protein